MLCICHVEKWNPIVTAFLFGMVQYLLYTISTRFETNGRIEFTTKRSYGIYANASGAFQIKHPTYQNRDWEG